MRSRLPWRFACHSMLTVSPSSGPAKKRPLPGIEASGSCGSIPKMSPATNAPTSSISQGRPIRSSMSVSTSSMRRAAERYPSSERASRRSASASFLRCTRDARCAKSPSVMLLPAAGWAVGLDAQPRTNASEGGTPSLSVLASSDGLLPDGCPSLWRRGRTHRRAGARAPILEGYRPPPLTTVWPFQLTP